MHMCEYSEACRLCFSKYISLDTISDLFFFFFRLSMAVLKKNYSRNKEFLNWYFYALRSLKVPSYDCLHEYQLSSENSNAVIFYIKEKALIRTDF